ncbi:MAG: PHP domain-containing protein [Parahaliea sp.]
MKFSRCESVRFVLIDFHTHTQASDGELSPQALLERAVAARLESLAITDHDTIAGYLAVCDSVLAGHLQLISGVELSCQWSGVTVHIVGLDFNVEHPVMQAGLEQLTRARFERGRKIGQRLEKRGFIGALVGAMGMAGGRQLGRPDFAAWLLAEGHVNSINEAFDKYLGQGKVGDVKAFWPELAEVTRWIVEAGGTAVIAHPLKYRLTRSKLRRLVADFQLAGGRAVELINGRQRSDQTAVIARLARECSLAISVGSDFHRDSTYGPQLGVDFRPPTDLQMVSERWLGTGTMLRRATL